MGNFKSGFQSLAQTTKICRMPILEFFNSIELNIHTAYNSRDIL